MGRHRGHDTCTHFDDLLCYRAMPTRHEHLRCRSPVADRGMRPHRVVVTTPAFDDDLHLPQRVEDFAIEQLVAQPGIKTLDEPVLPWTARCDVGGLCSDGTDPLLHRLGNALRAVSERTCPGTPRRMNRSESTSMTSIDLSRRGT